MKSLTHILRTKTALIILAALVVVIGFFFFWAKTRQPSKELPLGTVLPPPVTESQAVSVQPQTSELRGKFKDFPKELMVYRIESPVINHNQALEIAANFSFQDDPFIAQDIKRGPVYNWSAEEKLLTIVLEQGLVTYNLDLLKNPEILKGKLASEAEIKKAASAFLETQIIPLPQNLKPDIKQVTYLRKSGPIYKKSSTGQAEVAQVDFEFRINEIPLLTPTPEVYPLSLKIGPEMKIVEVEYQSPFKKLIDFGTSPLKTEKEVLEEIEAKPKISYSQSLTNQYQVTQEDYEKIQSLEFDQAELIYFLPALPEEFLQPAYSLSGTAMMEDNKVSEVFLYLPAISLEQSNL